MQRELVKALIPYQQVFKRPPPKRKLWSNWFVEEMHLAVEKVVPEEAPIAYKVRFGMDGSPRNFAYPIRAYIGDLWWPIGGDYNYVMHPESFATMLQDGHPETLVLFDSSFADCTRKRPLLPFPEKYRRVDHDWNNLGNQQALAQRGASMTIFCDEGTFVRGGEPVVYAVPAAAHGKILSLVVGLSDPRRETDGTSRSGPGPSRAARAAAARRGLAFGIGEVDDAVRALEARGYTVKRNYDIDVLVERHRPGTAPMMCSRELARHIILEAEKKEPRSAHLRAEIPAIEFATTENIEDHECVDALRQLCASKDPLVAFNFRKEVRAASSILERVGNGPLAPEDDSALGNLGLG